MKKTVCHFICILSVACAISLYPVRDIYASSESYVKILEIEPDPSVPLKIGSEIHFKAKVEYKVKEDSAIVNLLIQKGKYSGSLDTIVGSVQEVLTQGKGSVILGKTVKIPNTKALQVFTPLLIPGQTQTSIVDMKFYKVVK